MNLRDEVDKLKREGFSEANAESKICQDIVLWAISKSGMCKNATIKGGVVMRSLSKDARRATRDLDLDFIRYSISDDSIRGFIERLNCLESLSLYMDGTIIELNHQDYKGKRINLNVEDIEGTILSLKMDIGVHNDLSLEQEEYGFDVAFQDDVIRRVERVFNNKRYIQELDKSGKNWLGIPINEVLESNLEFLRTLM